MRYWNFPAIALVFAFYFPPFGTRADEKAALEKTRQELRAKGFKTDLSDFNFSASADEFKRSSAIKAADPRSRRPVDPQQGMPNLDALRLRTIITSNSALVVWTLPTITEDGPRATDWPSLRDTFRIYKSDLDAAAQALECGKYAFDLQPSAGGSMLLPHLSPVKNVARAFATRAMLELHDGHSAAAWSNVLATTRIVTHWRIEPVEYSHLVQCACAIIAFDTAWQALQTNGWTDDQLLALQKEWESLDCFGGFDEMLAFDAASAAQMCAVERTNLQNLKMPLQDALRHPTGALDELHYYEQQRDYREHGSYDDEKSLLEFYFQQQQDILRALQCKTWSEMQKVPAVTNGISFQSKYRSRVQFRLNMLSMRRAMTPDRQLLTIVGRAADMEARRRVLVTAIALERFRLRHHAYPERLAQLVPEFLVHEPIDFCDGKPLRYQKTKSRFTLYSIGLDGVDDGGVVQDRSVRRSRASSDRDAHVADDIVWLRPSSDDDMRERDQELARLREDEMMKGIQYRRRFALENKSHVEELSRLYGRPRIPMTNEPTFAGRPLKDLLGKDNLLGRTNATLEELLTLKQVKTGEEPEVVTFELPIQHDTMTNLGSLTLLVDPEVHRAVRTWSRQSPAEPEFHRVIKGTNGNCRIQWSTIFIPPGKHFLMTEFAAEGSGRSFLEDESYVVHGPMVPFEITNVCYFDIVSTTYDPTNGGPLYAFLAESNATYEAELKAPSGQHIRGYKGTTTNGIIDIRWDAKDENGKYYGNGWVDTIFDITLTGSGKHQKLKGP